jgi:hypothetical protein
MLRALSVADDWWAMQGYAEPKLPPWLVLGSETLTLQLAAGVVILLALGWRSRHMTALAWVSACAFQFTSRGTGDYHNAVLCTLLFWSLALPTGHALSLDRRSGRWAGWPRSSVTAASVGLITTLAWIYLSTAASKSGAAWWQEGSAVWLALLDRGAPTTPGRWLALQMPGNLWPWITWLSLGIEWLAAPLLLWRRSRPFVVAPLMGFHLLMWPLLALGSFLLVMLVALVVLLPGTFWDRLGWFPLAQTSESDAEPQHQPTRSRSLAALMALAILTTAEGERVVAWEGEEVWPYAGAQQVARLRYLLGIEAVWGMYAPEPFRNVGWWIAVAWHADGTVTDPITGSVPTMQPPSANGTGSRLCWMAMSDAPFISSDEDGRWGVQDLY